MHAIDAGLDVALIIMENGGTTASADRALAAVVSGLGGEPVHTVWRTDVVIATTVIDGASAIYVRHILPLASNLFRVAQATTLADRVGHHELEATAVNAEVARIRSAPPPYPLPVVVLAACITAGSFSHLTGGDWGSFAICVMAAGIGQGLRSALQHYRLPSPFVTVVCAALSAFIAGLGLRARFSASEPATLVASVVYMIPGLSLVNGFVDMTSPKYIAAGAQRIAYTLFTVALLATGIAIGDAVAR